MDNKLVNPQKTIETIQKYQFAFQKRFGQNFLIDSHVLDKIVNAAGITQDDCVLEIGPGIGTMTQYLAEHAGRVVAVEIDTNLLPILAETLKDYSNVTVINEDILKVDMNQLVKEYNQGRPIKVVANLPYYITTPIIMGLFESNVPIENITVMVQKEVARIRGRQAGLQGLRRSVPGGAVLRQPLYRGKCASKLLYPPAKCGFCSNSSDPLSGTAGSCKGYGAYVPSDPCVF